jgi:integrase
VLQIVQSYAREMGIEKLAPHDMRRTCAKLCRKRGDDLEQIKFFLGHASIQTTERNLGTEQDFVSAVKANAATQHHESRLLKPECALMRGRYEMGRLRVWPDAHPPPFGHCPQ